MSHKQKLREQRYGTVINKISSKQEKLLLQAIKTDVIPKLEATFPEIRLDWVQSVHLMDCIEKLKEQFPQVEFSSVFNTSCMKPDGGILSIVGNDNQTYPILIAEKKNQGTNDIRAQEGKKKQAKGNAIERLGKNVIGFRASMLSEGIFPFVCFGDGCDFDDDSSIRDRVVTIAMFGKLNQEYLHNAGDRGCFNRGTFYFRREQWTQQEMAERSYSIAEKSVYYYFSKYSREYFIN